MVQLAIKPYGINQIAMEKEIKRMKLSMKKLIEADLFQNVRVFRKDVLEPASCMGKDSVTK
jgi:tRNA G46 methylase TrmB